VVKHIFKNICDQRFESHISIMLRVTLVVKH